MAANPENPLLSHDKQPAWLAPVLLIPGILLLVATTIYGITEVHSSTDTYIGLAGGRAVLEATDGFPVTDTNSYTFYGQPWLNQNWGTHVFQYWLYTNFGPDAVIWGTWTMSSFIFLGTLAAVWFRTRSVLAGLAAASVIAFGCRDFISARPATTGFFAISAMWMLICALEGMSGKCRRAWPLIGIFVLMVAWGNSHGSFIFGYVVFGLFAAYWGVVHLWRRFLPTSFSALDIGLALFTLVSCWFACSKTINEKWFSQAMNQDKLGQAYAIVSVAAILLAAALMYLFYQDRRREPSVSLWQVYGVLISIAAAFFATWIFGPFGWENFVHGQKVGDSETWRSVSEWHPPYLPGNRTFPPFWRIWYILYALFAIVPIIGAMRLFAVFGQTEDQKRVDPPGLALPRITAFDILAIGIGLIMMFFARRFAPIFLIFAAPTIATWIILVGRQIPQVSRWAPSAISAACLLMLGFAISGASGAIAAINKVYPADAKVGLLERVTRFDATPTGLLDYLSKNDIEANLLAEWTQAGIVMFYAPKCRVYMDGRAQQVYDVEHYDKYRALMMSRNLTAEQVRGEFDRTGTNLIMLRYNPGLRHLHDIVQKSNDWKPLISGRKGVIMIRNNDPLYQQLRERADRGEEWRPNTAAAQLGLGYMYRYTQPIDRPRAMREWVSAVRRDQELGRVLYRSIVIELAQSGALRQAAEFVQAEQTRLNNSNYSAQTKNFLTRQLQGCQQIIRQAQQQQQRNREGG